MAKARVPLAALEARGAIVPGKLARVHMGDGAAAACSNYGAGLSTAVTVLARRVREIESPRKWAFVALRISGRESAVADALSRFTLRVSAQGRHPKC